MDTHVVSNIRACRVAHSSASVRCADECASYWMFFLGTDDMHLYTVKNANVRRFCFVAQGMMQSLTANPQLLRTMVESNPALRQVRYLPRK